MKVATYRCVTSPTVERWSCCGEPTSGGQCQCQRERNAALKRTTTSTTTGTTSAPPSPWTRGLAQAQGRDPEAAERERHQVRERHQAAFEADRKARIKAAENRPPAPPRPWSLAIERERGAA